MVFPCFWKESWSAAIVNHLWQSTLVILIAWMLTVVLRRNPARVRYVIWMAASLKLLVPFSMLTAIGEWLHPSSTIPVPVPPITGAMVQITHPFFGIARESFSLSSGASGYMAAVSSPASQQHLPVPEVLCLLWLCGCFFLLLRWSRAWLAIRAAVRSASQTSLLSDVPVFSTRSLMEPGIVGIFRPVMLLPEKALDLPAAQLNTILAHECFHNRRHDNLTAAMHMLVEAIFWFHPAVWWIERRLIEERERACDEAVLQHGNEAAVYAETILNVCKFCAESPIPCVSGVTGAELKQRILRIMTNQVVLPLNLSRRVLLVIIAAAAISTPVLFGLLHISEVLAQSAPISPTSGVVATWQGILHTDRDLHFVFKTTRSNGATSIQPSTTSMHPLPPFRPSRQHSAAHN